MNLVPFDSGNVPAAIVSRRAAVSTNNFIGNATLGGFPSISIKGKVFHITRGGERTLITKPGEDDPAASLEVVVLDINPDNSKVFYASGYQEGSDAKPNCYSNNGKAPEKDAAEPQAKSCAACAHNQWGSRITPDGKKGKSCADSRRMAIATPDTPNDPMLVRVPAASLKAMIEYGKILAARGTAPHEVITKIGFDYSVAHPALTFKPIAFIGDAAVLDEIEKAVKADIVKQILGMQIIPASEVVPEESPAEQAAPVAIAATTPVAAAPKPAAPKPAAKVVSAAASVEAAVAAAATTKKVEVKVEAPAAPVAAPASSALEDQIGSMIDGMDFDD